MVKLLRDKEPAFRENASGRAKIEQITKDVESLKQYRIAQIHVFTVIIIR